VPSASAAAAAAAMRRNGVLNVSLLVGRAGSPRRIPRSMSPYGVKTQR
jgi:hypothetical protein